MFHVLRDSCSRWNWGLCKDLWSRLQEGVRLIDHHSLLMAKLMQYDINPYIINWIAAFLSNKFSADTSSGLFKYVDDTTVYEVVENKGTSHAQALLTRCLHGLLRTISNSTPVNAMELFCFRITKRIVKAEWPLFLRYSWMTTCNWQCDASSISFRKDSHIRLTWYHGLFRPVSNALSHCTDLQTTSFQKELYFYWNLNSLVLVLCKVSWKYVRRSASLGSTQSKLYISIRVAWFVGFFLNYRPFVITGCYGYGVWLLSDVRLSFFKQKSSFSPFFVPEMCKTIPKGGKIFNFFDKF